MPEDYSNFILPDKQTIFDTKIDTQMNLEKVFNQVQNFELPTTTLQDYLSQKGQVTPDGKASLSLEDALSSDNESLRNTASSIIRRDFDSDPSTILRSNMAIRTPIAQAEKYIDKEFGFDPTIPDIEDFYYKNSYMHDGWAYRNLIKNPARFIGRVIPQAALKLGEGLGYVGSMIGSIGSDNYWADVADNSFSKYLEGAEQELKDQWIPVYKQAGFDEKGFFSKLIDWSFWNESVADAVAFMTSAIVPGLGFAKLGKGVQWFGEAFSTASKLGKGASAVGMGSPAQLASWTFNTAMESAQEGAGVFKETKRNLEDLRARGVEGYANLTDEDIRKKSGAMAANTIGGNFMVLALSNAYENTLFFKKGVGGTDVKMTGDFFGKSKALDNLVKKNPFASSLSKTRFYGAGATKGVFAEGLWEENAQLAIQRMNTIGPNGEKQRFGPRTFFENYFSQIGNAFSGKDQEAAESIGLGALIGIGAGTVFSKLHGDRKGKIAETKRVIAEISNARSNLFNNNDVFERDSENRIVFEGDQPKVDPKKLEIKKEALGEEFGKLAVSNLENSKAVELQTKLSLANYVRSMKNIGIEDIGTRLTSLSPEQAELFGLNPKKPNEKGAEYKTLAENFEEHSKNVDNIRYNDVPSLKKEEKDFAIKTAKNQIYNLRAANEILAGFAADQQSVLLAELNKSRNLTNTSLAQYPVDQLNTLIYKRKLTQDMLDEDISDVEREYHQNYLSSLDAKIESYKKDNELSLQDAEEVDGYYVALTPDGKRTKLSKEGKTALTKIAEYENVIDANNYKDTLLSDTKNWYNNLDRLSETPLVRALQEELRKQEIAIKNSPFSKYTEIKQGDFAAITRMVAKIISGEEVSSPEELQLRANYSELVNQLIPLYEKAIKDNTTKIYENRLNTITKRRDYILEHIIGNNRSIIEKNRTINKLVDDMQQSLNNDKIGLEDIKLLLEKLELEINSLKDTIAKDEESLNSLDRQILALEQEIQGGTLQGLKGALEETKKEREWVIDEIKKNKSLLEKLKQIVKDWIKYAKKLFPFFKMKQLDKILDPVTNTYGEKNRENYDQDIVTAYDEVNLAKKDVADTQKLIDELALLIPDLDLKIALYNTMINNIETLARAEMEQQYKILTGINTAAAPTQEAALTAAIQSDIVNSISNINTKSDNPEEEERGDYVRPLETKFFTSTFPDSQKIQFSKAENDHFQLLASLSDATRVQEIRKKIGKGKLKVIAVTRDNVSKLGLKDLLYQRIDINGNVEDTTKFWENPDESMATVALVHVIEEAGKVYYIDKDLNRIGELNSPNKNIVYTLLRAVEFKEWEKKEYDKLYGEDKQEIAKTAGKLLREKIFAKARTFTVDAPNTIYNFNITKGIANKLENKGGPLVKNPVIGVLLNQDQIEGQSVLVAGPSGTLPLNASLVNVKPGRSFIKTKGIKEQLHYTDNNKLEDEQANTILNVFKKLSEEYVKGLEEVMKVRLKDKKLSELSPSKKVDIMVEYNNIKGINRFNKNYFSFINSVVYFDFLEKEEIEDPTQGVIKVYKPPHPKQIYIKGNYIYFGDTRIDMTNSEAFLTTPKVKEFILGLHHNIRYYVDRKKTDVAYTEYYMDGDELKSREWSTYSHYLLSDKFPDGTARTFIPITTQIKNKAQQALESDLYFPYKSQAIIIDEVFAEGVGKNVQDSKTEVQDDEVVDFEDIDYGEIIPGPSIFANKNTTSSTMAVTPKVTVVPTPMKSGDSFLAGMIKAKTLPPAESVPVEEAPTSQPPADQAPASQGVSLLAGMIAAKTKKPDTPESNDTGLVNNFDEQFRISKGGFFKTEENLDEKIAEAKRLLPQFPVERLKKAIQTMDGREAFGQFVNNTIRIWEDAEEGTIYHEMFEGVANRILSNAEWRSIEKEFHARPGTFIDRETGVPVTFKKATAHQAKEQLAEEFREFKMNGKLPAYKNTRTFFQVILDFIKKLFGNVTTINNLFQNIDKGKLSRRALQARDRFVGNYSMSYPIPYEDYHNLLQGATAFMFRDIFLTPESLTQLDELGEMDSVVYERIKSKIDAIYNDFVRQTLPISEGGEGKLSEETNNRALNEKNRLAKLELYRTVAKWEVVKERWGSFVQHHKIYMRHLNIKFDDEYNLSEEDNEMKNRNDYTNKEFSVSAKSSASTSIRFLVGSLIQMNAVDLTIVDKFISPKLSQRLSSANLPQLENYDSMMLKVLEELSGLNRLDLIESKLRDISGITSLQNVATEEEQLEIVKSLNREQTAMVLLYNRLFSPTIISEDAKWNLKVKFHSYVSKYKPNAHILMVQDGDSNRIESQRRPAYEAFIRRMTSSMINNISTIAYTRMFAGKKQFVSKVTDDIDFNDFVSNKNSTGTQKIKEFINFMGLGEIITREFVQNLHEDQRNELATRLLTIRNKLKTFTPFSGNITLKNLNIQGYTSGENGLINFLDNIAPISEKSMQFLGGDNEARQIYMQPSFISRIITEINNTKDIKDLYKAYPHLAKSWSSNSLMIKRMFNPDGSRTDVKLSLDYIEGMKRFQDDGTFKKSAKLEEHQRLGMQFLMNLEGFYYSLPADSETEWMFNMGEFVPYKSDFLETNQNQIINNIFIPNLVSEIQTALDFPSFNRLHQLNEPHANGELIGQSLRFFKDILGYHKVRGEYSNNLVDKIHKAIKEGKTPAIKIISANKEKIQEAIKNYLEQKTVDTMNNLIDQRVVIESTSNDITLYSVQNLTTDLKAKFGAEVFSQSQLRDVVAYGVVNSHIGNMEQFKLFFGDVAQYKDWEKRAKSMFGPVEQTVYDETGEFNDYLNREKNTVFLEETKVALPEKDLFHISYKNHLNARTINDITVVNPEVANTLKRLGAAFQQAYHKTNEADGQSIGTIQMAKQLMIKSGWRWTKANEIFYQYDTALARQELSKSGKYTYTSEELRELDAEIVEFYKDDIPSEGISPVKTLVPSVRPDGTHDLLKHSVYFISYQLAKDTELLPIYLDMLKRGDDLINFKSAHKVGVTIDDKGNITDFYENPFRKTDLEKAGNMQFPVSFRTLGIQVETQGTKKGQTLGSQFTKLIFLNMTPGGVPNDYRFRPVENNEVLSEEAIVNKWISLSEDQKLEISNDYRLVKKGITALENMKDKSVMDTFQKIGVQFDIDEKGNINYYPADLKKLRQFIEDEMLRLEIDNNTIQSMQLTEDFESFLSPSEGLPTYNTVSNIVWAIADKAINAIKVQGKPYIQVASTFFNKETRKAAYQDKDKNWIVVDNEEDYLRLQKEGKKLVMTSSELKFYTLKKGDNGEDKEISAMEVYLPHIYKKAINKERAKRKLPSITDEALMKYLNEHPELLEGLGFRIPTQATSSLEFFVVKGFLPESFGSAIVVPSDITTKAGSDFDVDKLSTYLNNWRLGKNGMPEIETFKEWKDEETLEEMYADFIRDNTEDIGDIIREMKTSKEYVDTKADISLNYDKIDEMSPLIDESKASVIEEKNKGRIIFSKLPLSIKQQYWQWRDEMDNSLGPISVTATYYTYTKMFIEQLESTGEEAVMPLEIREKGKIVKSQEVVNVKRVTNIMKAMLVNYDNVVTKYGLKDEAWKKLHETIENARNNKSIKLRSFNHEMNTIIAEGLGLMSLDKFRKLPTHLQNTKGAVQNEYFKSLRTILKQPERYIQLLSINTMGNITENKEAVLHAKDTSVKLGEKQKEKVKKSINYSNFLDINYLVNKRQAFAKGKFDIGIFAVAMTNLANSQIVGLGFTNGIAKIKDEYIMKLNNYDISLPFDEVELRTINGSPFISLSDEKDAEGKYTMDKISGYLNGAVDVAKEPDIVEMGMHTIIAGSYMILERAGVPGKKVALFLQQPIIREYLKELIYLRNKDFGYSSYSGVMDLRRSLLTKYGGENPVYERINFTESLMTAMIRKGEVMKKEVIQARSETLKERTEWTESEKQMQYLAFVNFLKIDMLSQNLLESIQGSNHDTSKMRSSYAILRKDLIAKRATTEGNLIMSPTMNGYKFGVLSLREDTFVQKTIEAFREFNTIFSDINLFALQKQNPRRVLSSIALRLFKTRPYQTADEFDKIMKEYEASMIDSLMNNRVGDSRNIKLSSFTRQFFQPVKVINEGTDQVQTINKNNIFVTFNAIQQKYPNEYKNNFFLQNLTVDLNEDLGVYLLGFKKIPSRDDILTRNLLIEGLNALHQSDIEDIQKFADMIDIASIIQFGVKTQRFTLTPYIPWEYYSQYSQAAFANIDNEPFATFEEEVIRENAYKTGFVPDSIPFFTMLWLNENGSISTEWANKKVKKAKPRLSERTWLTNDQKVRPTFLWNTYLDLLPNGDDLTDVPSQLPPYVNIRMVKPEYVMRQYVPYPNGDGGIEKNVLTQEARDMIKRKDFSWAFTQTFKLVGADGASPAVLHKSIIDKGKHKGRTSLYALYKPINTYGFFSFGEKANLIMDEDGNVIGKQSILNNHLPVTEEKDRDIIQKLNMNTSAVIDYVNYIKYEYNQEEFYKTPVKTKPKKARDLKLKNLSITPKNLPPIEPSCE